jgi:hypothetical protein
MAGKTGTSYLQQVYEGRIPSAPNTRLRQRPTQPLQFITHQAERLLRGADLPGLEQQLHQPQTDGDRPGLSQGFRWGRKGNWVGLRFLSG